jgi:hypothetical protein
LLKGWNWLFPVVSGTANHDRCYSNFGHATIKWLTAIVLAEAQEDTWPIDFTALTFTTISCLSAI